LDRNGRKLASIFNVIKNLTQSYNSSIFCMKSNIFITCSLLLFFVSFHALAVPQGATRSSRIKHIQDSLLTHPESASKDITLILQNNNRANNGLITAIKASTAVLKRQKKNLFQVNLKANQVESFLNKLPQGVIARLPYPHTQTSVSQGVDLTGGTDMQNLGLDGSGVKIGIIDLGFSSLAASQTAGELPQTGAGLTITDYTGTGTGGTNHGTNVAEIVYDMAPGAELYLAKVGSLLDMEAAVSDMTAAGVSVINHSASWFGAAFYDGSGPVCDITNTADSSGIIWANAAGNSRKQHYLGTFTDADSNLQHEFASGQNYNTQAATSGKTYTFILNWDAYPSTTVDYNLHLYDGDPASGGNLLISSTNAQSGRGANRFPTPYEIITYEATATGTLYIVVTKKDSSTSNLPLTLFTVSGSLAIKTISSSVTQPADCASTLTVGATNLSDTAESFSSEGPTVDGRDKPDIAGPNRVVTSLSGSFAGTSAASPHVAGAAAQLFHQNPGFTHTQIRNLLINTSHDVNVAGYDFRTGFGRYSLDADSDAINHDDDNCLLNYNPAQIDTDLDTAGNACDLDDDDDGLTDVFELAIGSNTLIVDTDGDTISDYDEVAFDGDASNYNPETDLNPTSSDTDNDTFADNLDPIPLTFNFNDGDLAPIGAPDGIINAADYVIVTRLALEKITPSDIELSHGDLYPPGAPDGIINVSDLVLIRQLLN
jgi:hypothetical protein